MSLSNGWTGGQYSLFRAALGTYLFVHFLQLIPYGAELFSSAGVLPASASPLLHLPNVLALHDGPLVVYGVLATGLVCSAALAIGHWDRLAALLLWYVWACLFGRNPLISNPSLPYVGWILLAHVFIPGAPYGSWARRGQADPGSGWRLPGGLHLAGWALMALGYSYSGYTKLVSPSWVDGSALSYVLESPLARPTVLRSWLLSMPELLRGLSWAALGLELSFVLLALIRPARPWLWLSMLLMHLGLIVLIDFADLSLGMVMLHLFTFDPGWVKPRPAQGATLFYDGRCGLCHRTVRWVLSEDRMSALRFAPLGGDTFLRQVGSDTAGNLPDSLVVVTAHGEVLTRSTAVVFLLQALGGIWGLLGTSLAWVPIRVRDAAYDWVAAARYRLFAPPAQACPLLPSELRARFL